MKRFFLLLLVLASTVVLHQPTRAQSPLDSLPICNFSADAEIDELQLGVVIYNFQTGRGCVQNMDIRFPVASVPKVFIAGALLEAVAQGDLSFDREMVFSADYLMGGRGDCLTESMVGQRLTYGYLSDVMISCSDNAATWMLYDALGPARVRDYINRQGLRDVGPVLPYSQVDKLKLASLDARWNAVPAGLASQFYRSRRTDALVPAYFDSAPNLTSEDRVQANANYFSQYDYNTLTPRAMAQYLFNLYDDVQRDRTFDPQAQAAWWMVNTMMLTQRQYSTQAVPGTMFTAAKNGFDIGLRAEASLIFPDFASMQRRVPGAMVIVFARQLNFDSDNLQTFRGQNDTLNRYLTEISPGIVSRLYPVVPDPGAVSTSSLNISSVTFNAENAIRSCLEPYPDPQAIDVDLLEVCWQSLTPKAGHPVGEWLGMGVILRGLGGAETRLTFVFTGPEGSQASYQYSVQGRDTEHVFWFHRPAEPGWWRVDIYQNLHPVYTDYVDVIAPGD
jgi:beta-lactamase class A